MSQSLWSFPQYSNPQWSFPSGTNWLLWLMSITNFVLHVYARQWREENEPNSHSLVKKVDIKTENFLLDAEDYLWKNKEVASNTNCDVTDQWKLPGGDVKCYPDKEIREICFRKGANMNMKLQNIQTTEYGYSKKYKSGLIGVKLNKIFCHIMPSDSKWPPW